MTCRKCSHTDIRKFGTTAANVQRFQCRACRATFTATPKGPFENHTTSAADIERAFALLVEGVSIRAISRLTGIHKTTILSLLVTLGAKCAALFDERVQNLRPKCVQADELWTFVQKKQKRLRHTDPEERGDQYVWIAFDSLTKLVMTYHVGKRDGLNAYTFIADLDRRIVPHHRFQITTDGLADYIPAIEEHFGSDVDFAQLVKSYAAPVTSGPDWFRPSSRVTTITKVPVSGDPDDCKISTSHVERQNLTMRMHIRRLTRLTNGFSKKLVNLQAAIAIVMAYYNFCKVHSSLRVTPAMEAGLTDHVWSLSELLTAKFLRTAA